MCFYVYKKVKCCTLYRLQPLMLQSIKLLNYFLFKACVAQQCQVKTLFLIHSLTLLHTNIQTHMSELLYIYICMYVCGFECLHNSFSYNVG